MTLHGSWARPIFLLSLSLAVFQAFAQSGKATLWYDAPASAFEEALPIGNGHFGAMIFGGPTTDTLRLNHDTFWSGAPRKWNNPDAQTVIPALKKALHAGDYPRANTLAQQMQGPFNQSYQPLCDLILSFAAGNYPVQDYYRDLSLEEALTHVRYTSGEAVLQREYFVSYPDRVLVVRLSADQPGQIAFRAAFDSRVKHRVRTENGYLKIRTKAPRHVEPNYRGQFSEAEAVQYDEWGGQGMEAETWLKVVSEGGALTLDSASVRLEGADEAYLLIGAATSFRDRFTAPTPEDKEPATELANTMHAAEQKPYAALRQAHRDDYQKLYHRVSLQLPTRGDTTQNTRARLMAFQQTPDPSLVALLFQYGRYLLIASSRPGSQPANLQGIWSESVRPPWSSNYTININTEMNYWPAEVTNLSETHQPLLAFIPELAKNGAETARINYGLEGWVAHHNADLWAQSAPVGDFGTGDPKWANWYQGGAWLCAHLYEHYLFTGDQDYLQKIYPVLKGAAQFLEGMLVTNAEGKQEVFFGVSPEQTFYHDGERSDVSAGTAMDLALVRELLTRTAEAAETLRRDSAYAQQLRTTISRLQPFRINRGGQLMEWNEDFVPEDTVHRHISHLYGLHPGNQINPWSQPVLFAAAKNALLLRGDQATGWSMGWKTNAWARLLDGDHAYAIIKNLFRPILTTDVNYGEGGGLYLNLLDAHPPFQIDGNFGVCAGVAEMLLQSHAGALHLLPALPTDWSEGTVRGLKARGGVTVDIDWQGGALQRATLRAERSGVVRVRSAWPLQENEQVVVATGPDPDPLMAPIDPGAPQPEGQAPPVAPLTQYYEYDIAMNAEDTLSLEVR